MERVETPFALVEHMDALKGQWLRNSRDQTVWKILDVGREGVTTFQATHYGGETFGDETLITWRAVHAIYLVMVHAGEIDVEKEH